MRNIVIFKFDSKLGSKCASTVEFCRGDTNKLVTTTKSFLSIRM